ncbi:S-layer homology domain-containing protein [uncultured Cloacibacillus sp.]|uniref:S-layer homology domain-containing protein n=1 Tax=uncultured Cloacibacillus sp. TaxID=889794 RepID=UPI0026DBB5A5|nr:S-layer homology domain-containing protein [uncultured Cloacibacillus sp.]
MASVVARALVTVDAEKASKQDLELLKKLVMEFKDELDALGVKVDSLDKRVAVLEDNLGGWKLSGKFYFEADFAGGDQTSSKYTESGLDNSFQKSQFRLYLQKQISETTSFFGEFRAGSESAGAGTSGYGDISQINLRTVYVDTVLPWEIGFRVGRFVMDFEADHGLYVDNDAIYGDYRLDGFQFTKNWGSFSAKAIIGRNSGFDDDNLVYNGDIDVEYMTYALDLTWQPSEAFFVGINGVWRTEDGSGNPYGQGEGFLYADPNASYDMATYSAYLSYNFTPAIALQGLYYWQDLDDGIVAVKSDRGPAGQQLGTEDSPTAWKAVLDIKQDVLKFTSLRFEYMQHDNMFYGVRKPYSFDAFTGNAASITDNMPWNDGTSDLFFIYAEQKWNDKWSSYLRYQQADFDTNNYDDAKGYGIGVTYQYTPAIAFRLAYDHLDYGDGTGQKYNGDDHVIQFRTAINF